MPKPIKALTLHQPWATLVAVGAKTYETRSWSTDYRGPLAIHAAKTKEHEKLCFTEPFYTALQNANMSVRWLPYGTVVALCNLTSVVQVPAHGMVKLSHVDRQLGDFSPGRFAWGLSGIHKLPYPIEVRGQQRLWNWDFSDRPDYQVAHILAQIARYKNE